MYAVLLGHGMVMVGHGMGGRQGWAQHGRQAGLGTAWEAGRVGHSMGDRQGWAQHGRQAGFGTAWVERGSVRTLLRVWVSWTFGLRRRVH